MAAGHLARRTGHPAVGDDRDPLAAVLQHAEGGHQLVQLGHAVGGRALVADDGDEVAAVEAALGEGGEEVGLVVEDHRRRGHDAVLGLDGGGLDDRAAEAAREHPQAAVRGERLVGRAQHVGVEGRLRALLPGDLRPRPAAPRGCGATGRGPRP